MNYIIDRRLNGRDKSAVNRQRFLRRYRKHIKKAVEEAVTKRSITDIERGESVSIPKGDINEPAFGHGQGGTRSRVLPGNKEFVQGDLIEKPSGSGAGGAGQGEASDSGEGEDDFVFQLSQREFLEFMFEDLALPNLVKRQLAKESQMEFKRAGISENGNPGQINIIRSMRSAYGRRMALGSAKRKKLRVIEARLNALIEPLSEAEYTERETLLADQLKLQAGLKKIPFLDDFDLKYNVNLKVPKPSTKAVMFCVMDVSGSMDQRTKDIAKRFFILLYLFLKRNYEHTEVVFIRHHSIAKEVDEEEFFYSRETGGTVVSSALRLMDEVVKERYPSHEWNIYGAQASDGDNWTNDSNVCSKILTESLLPLLQYFCYIEITQSEHQDLWHTYDKIQNDNPDLFAMRCIEDYPDIYPVFRELFQKETA